MSTSTDGDVDSRIVALRNEHEARRAEAGRLRQEFVTRQAQHDDALRRVDIDEADRLRDEAEKCRRDADRADAAAEHVRGALEDLTRQAQDLMWRATLERLEGEIATAREAAADLLRRVGAGLLDLPALLRQAQQIEDHRSYLESERHTVRQSLGEIDATNGFNFLTVDKPIAHRLSGDPLLVSLMNRARS